MLASGAQAPPPQQTTETIVGIQIHGNTLTPDDEIRRIAGIQVGEPFLDATIESATRTLRDTKKFERVQVLKRFASIADPSQILLVVFVDEGPVKVQLTGDPDVPVRTVRTGKTHLMVLPVFNVEDGYGVTYGARFALPDPIGKGSRLAFPLTWGGDKRAALELDASFDRGPLNRLTAGVSASGRENPHYEADDDRVRGYVRGERQLVKWVRAGGTAGYQRVSFPGGEPTTHADTFPHGGADITFDTRLDPVLPRNAVFTRASWEHINGANRTDFDARGYVGLIGQSIVQLRVTRSDSDRPLAPYLKPLLGGMANLRGFSTGTAAGDTLVATSAELIVPLTSPVSFGRMGVSAFVDAGTTYDDGQKLADQTWRQGI